MTRTASPNHLSAKTISMRLLATALLFLTTLFLPGMATAQVGNEIVKLLPAGAATQDQVGLAVSASGDTAVIGAWQDDDEGNNAGAVYVFTRDSSGNWSQQTKLTANDGGSSQRFGFSVAISDDVLVVGAYGDNDNGTDSGAAYVFARSGSVWTEEDKITAGDGAALDRFGYSVAVSGNYAIVGAYREDQQGSDSGSAYVYQRIGGGWTQRSKLTADDGEPDDEFGFSVGISGDQAVVGAWRHDQLGINSGAAYVYERGSGTAWSQQAKLTASDGGSQDQLGSAVAISNGTVIAGAYQEDSSGANAGAAYVFVDDGSGNWSQQAKLNASDGAAVDQFGFSVAIEGNLAIVGAESVDDGGTDSGGAYVFKRTGSSSWAQQVKLLASDGQAGDRARLLGLGFR